MKKRRRRSIGPDFGRMARKRKDGRLLGLVIVLILSAAVGTGAYLLCEHNLKEGGQVKTPSSFVTPAPGDLTNAPSGVPTGTPFATITPGQTGVTKPPEGQIDQGGGKTVSVYGSYPDGFLTDFVDTRKRTNVKGIYVNTNYLDYQDYPDIDELIELLDKTELNAMVIDIKDDYGNILYDSNIPLINEMGIENVKIKDLKAFISKLKEHDIYCIARIVAMKDMTATKKRPSMAVQNKNGTVYVDGEGVCWLNPYSEEVWDYLTSIAREAVEAGFDEINFDYLRTSASNSLANASFGDIPADMTKMDAIIAFVKHACQEIKPLGAFVSGDVFAAIISSVSDGTRIGQSYVELAKYLDYICPMAYPSHYSFGYGGYKYPDKEPFELILMEMKSSVKKLSVIPEGEFKAEVRPWLQDFTASYLGEGRYLVYGGKEVRQQISATYSAGYSSWFLWNAGMWFSEDGLLEE